MQLILVRHALPQRVEHGDGTFADPGLTPEGHAQARRLVAALDGEPVDALYTSTMRRAVQTAAPLATARGLTSTTRADLREFDAERTEYVPIAQLAEADPESWERMRNGYLPGHVDADAFLGRVRSGIEEIVASHPGRATAVVVAHAGVVNAYLAAVLGTDRTLPFPLDYVGVTRVVCARDGLRKARTVNDISHVRDLV
ncbi:MULTISPECIES: histidine phosphatase family protein [Pseudonocardia]|uniref:Phosphoglycerate mutase n=2 Tax=Pseudonocardia TaxID=1847 RepID=A0ABQ0RWU3_9PSEU|nr:MULTISPECIES: histidine phosphatase family protein [Pseudonocardia]OSY40400.1 putative phosphoserine phosphatase 2 [Pseudonocardia autotrophica]TDN72269.1 putative phosphoglycerate mutase [Pseudonocardia autotrophica]BBG02981.1 phosphoglycerate mutase [Pseudonocardia autotrophica]GEC25118.1 phosphoglycerate mutase [Pseudonocardia saturnea]